VSVLEPKNLLERMPTGEIGKGRPTPYESASPDFAFAAFVVSVLGYLVSRASYDVSRSHPEKRTPMSSYWSICAIALRKGASEICRRP
jgi:hypothetical protein